MSQDATSCGCGKSPIATRVELWSDGWAPTRRRGSKARSIFEDQFRTMLSEILDEIELRARERHAAGQRIGSLKAALTQVRAELCGERKP